MDKIYLSPSSLAAWYDMGCPAQWKFDRDWEPIEPNPITEFGTKVHKMLEDPEYAIQEIPNDRRAASYYGKIKAARDSIVAEILHTEIKERFEIYYEDTGLSGKYVMWGRRIDLIARLKDGSMAVIDYKTHLGRGWKSIRIRGGEVYPQSLGFQSMGYLIGSPQSMSDVEDPSKVIYIVGSMSSAAQVIEYEPARGDADNFISLVRMAAESIEKSNWEKRPGKHCHDCKFAAMCYKSPGWKKMYKERYSGNK